MKRKTVRHRPSHSSHMHKHTDSKVEHFKPGDLRPYALGNALGLMSMIILIFYGLFVWFSDYETAFIIAKYPIGFSFYDWTILFGLLQSYVMFYVAGWVFAKLYNSV